jgi:hypothetical protein
MTEGDLTMRRPTKLATAAMAVATLTLLAAPSGASPASRLPRPRVVEIHGRWTGRAPGPAPTDMCSATGCSTQTAQAAIEVGENTLAGLLNGTFVTTWSDDGFPSGYGSYLLHHRDTITSKTFTHRDSHGVRVPDTIDDDLTVTVILENGFYRSVFIGTFSGGTGVFQGAEGYYTGDGTEVVTPAGGDPAASYFSGSIGGELRLP